MKQTDNFAAALGVFGIQGNVTNATAPNHGEINRWFGKSEDMIVAKAARAFRDDLLLQQTSQQGSL